MQDQIDWLQGRRQTLEQTVDRLSRSVSTTDAMLRQQIADATASISEQIRQQIADATASISEQIRQQIADATASISERITQVERQSFQQYEGAVGAAEVRAIGIDQWLLPLAPLRSIFLADAFIDTRGRQAVPCPSDGRIALLVTAGQSNAANRG